MQHVVFITGSYGKYMSPGGNIASGIVDQLKKRYQVTLITHKEHFDDGDTLAYESTEHYFIDDNGSCVHNYCVAQKRKCGKCMRVVYDAVLAAKRGCYALSMFLRRYGYSEKLKRRTVKLLEQINRKKPIDVLIAVSEPHDAVFAALEYKKAHSKCRFFAYQLDRFSNGMSLYKWKIGKKRAIERNVRKELELLSIADRLFVLPPIKKHYDQVIFDGYKDKIEMTEHPLVRAKAVGRNDCNGTIMYAGSFDASLRNPSYWLEMANTAAERQMEFPKTVLYSFGNCEGMIERYLSDHKVDVAQKGRVSYGEVQTEYGKCGYVLIIGNRSSEEVPSKVFDCISYGKPIIFLFYGEDDPVLPYLEEYPLSVCVRMEDGELARNTEKVADFCKANRGKSLDIGTILRSFEKCTPEYVSDQFIRAIEKG